MSHLTLTLHRRGLIALGLAAAVGSLSLTPLPVLAFEGDSKNSLNLDKSGIAIRGYDPVAYFTAGKPTLGDAKFSATQDGATYHFASAANRDAFLKEPAKYAPAFGGFCAMGASLEKKFDGDPGLWKIVDGKLYLNVSADAQKAWEKDVPGNISKADRNWPAIKDKAPKDL